MSELVSSMKYPLVAAGPRGTSYTSNMKLDIYFLDYLLAILVWVVHSTFDLCNILPLDLKMWQHISVPTDFDGHRYRPSTPVDSGKEGFVLWNYVHWNQLYPQSYNMSAVSPPITVSGIWPPIVVISWAVFIHILACISMQYPHKRFGE